jgi:hypothetical protein
VLVAGPFIESGLCSVIDVKDEMETTSSDFSYLTDTTPFFYELTDVQLVISTGKKLPAHSAYLAAHSSVFSGMLETHFASDSQSTSPATIPLPDCSLQEAQKFLCYLYAIPTDAQLTPESARAIVKLAHKFDVQMALKQCDAFLAQHAKHMPLWVSRHSSLSQSKPFFILESSHTQLGLCC